MRGSRDFAVVCAVITIALTAKAVAALRPEPPQAPRTEAAALHAIYAQADGDRCVAPSVKTARLGIGNRPR